MWPIKTTAGLPIEGGYELGPGMDDEDDLSSVANVQMQLTREESTKATTYTLLRKCSTASESFKDLFVHDIPVHVDETTAQTLSEFKRVSISETTDDYDDEVRRVCHDILEVCKLRDKYSPEMPAENWGNIDKSKFIAKFEKQKREESTKGTPNYHHRLQPPFIPFPENEEESLFRRPNHANPRNKFRTVFFEGVMRVSVRDKDENDSNFKPEKHHERYLEQVPSFAEFCDDLFHVIKVSHDAATKSLCFRRLKLLESLFDLHVLLNSEKETAAQRTVPHRDFYNIRKVDTHVHHSAIMNQKHLLRFIKSKLKRFPDEIVIKRDGQFLSLCQVFLSLKLTAYDLSIDTLDMHADNTFHRFDRFNLKYNPVGESRLREIFLKCDNHLNGRYLAEITKEVFNDCHANKYVMLEPRTSVCGRSRTEWSKLGKWYSENRMASPHARWMIQIPRLYSVYKSAGLVNSFQDILTNIFEPLFEVTLDPESDPDLWRLLDQVTGFDCVDDESKYSRINLNKSLPQPQEWESQDDPPFSYWIYYIYANLHSLNTLRLRLGLSTFSFRPHAGEAYDQNNLAATFLCAQSINHGILLRKAPALQYLYYLKQVGLAVSPLSNNKLFLAYHSNPFRAFFARGLNVSLSTDDPLMLHVTKDPLVEEYSVAQQLWRLSNTDSCEIARNSVLQSGFEYPYKSHFLGEGFLKKNNIAYTNVPDIRIIYRRERLTDEWDFVTRSSKRVQ